MARAREAAGGKDVLVHGARTAQRALARPASSTSSRSTRSRCSSAQAAVCSTTSGPGHIELELTRIIDAPGVTHLRYRVRR
jgi:hypothetical protein